MRSAAAKRDRTTAVVEVPRPSLTAARPRDATLTVLRGPEVGALIGLSLPTTEIGREPAKGVRVDGEGVSRRHARFFVMEGQPFLEDLASTNGTFVNGIRIYGPVRLAPGDQIQLGPQVTVRFAWLDRLEQEAAQRTFELSLRDGLTGLYNRRAFDDRLEQEMAYAARHRTALGLIVLDLDHFKSINDRFGHPCGDRVLELVAATMIASVRTEDLVARYGGEELAVITRGIDPLGVHAVADRLRAKIAALEIVWERTRVPVTASLGVAHTAIGGHEDPAAIVRAADEALYRAKRGGRNRVAVERP